MNAGPVDVLVAGGGGFIGGHLVADLLAQGKTVRSVDVKPLDEWYQVHPDAQNSVGDLSLLDQAEAATKGAREVYMLAADMGGMGFIENNKALCMLTVLTSTHMLQAAQKFDVERYFRDAPLMIVGEGTNEIQRNVIARQLVARGSVAP